MKTGKKLMITLMIVLIIGLLASCASTGNYMPLSTGETVLGTTQTTFMVQSAMFSLKSVQDSVNTQAYIHLQREANEKYSGAIDIRDIVWVTGQTIGPNTEISATGKVVQVN